ncbi:MAG: hypothetical protein HYW26_00140 [Candidatus Aenigmarchaeota archaeon]|nr:hypothetical protein [Candidatus Aenigmarchaeota archaeon]
MKQGAALVLVLAAVAAVAVFSIKQPAASAPVAAAPLTEAKILAFIDQCTSELLTSGRDYVVCGLDGNFVQLKGSSFKPGELFSVQANLKRLANYDTYYVCVVRGPVEKVNYPQRFAQHEHFEGTYLVNRISCGTESLLGEDFHTANVAGFAPKEKGRYLFMAVHIFPDGVYRSVDDFLDKIGPDTEVLRFEGEVL